LLHLKLPPPAARLARPGSGDGLQELHRCLATIERRQDQSHPADIRVGPGRWLDFATAELALAEGLHQCRPVDRSRLRARGFHAAVPIVLADKARDDRLNRLASNEAAINGQGSGT
jgi:hypothetical protein